MIKKVIITTSWDDGDQLDLKLIQLLNKYNLKGTFYVRADGSWSTQELRNNYRGHEIGAHTVNHPRLAEVEEKIAGKEIVDSREYLANILGQRPKMFCYPFGSFNDQIKKIVKDQGFIGARTTEEFRFTTGGDPFALGTTIHIYPFPLRKKDKDHYHFSRFLFQPLQKNFKDIIKLKLPPAAFLSWASLSKSLFDYALKNGGVYHLWGHSWEVEKYGMWPDLEAVFKYIANRSECLYLTNSQVLEQVNL